MTKDLDDLATDSTEPNFHINPETTRFSFRLQANQNLQFICCTKYLIEILRLTSVAKQSVCLRISQISNFYGCSLNILLGGSISTSFQKRNLLTGF